MIEIDQKVSKWRNEYLLEVSVRSWELVTKRCLANMIATATGEF
jgi:hypothetical protein